MKKEYEDLWITVRCYLTLPLSDCGGKEFLSKQRSPYSIYSGNKVILSLLKTFSLPAIMLVTENNLYLMDKRMKIRKVKKEGKGKPLKKN